MNNILNDFNFKNYVVVGVSAGPDSMCLLNLLEEKTNKIVVCHINHNVREESIKEEAYLRDYCTKHNLIFEVMTIKDYSENNFENEARKKRYVFYEEILKKYNSNMLFLAHHGDDLIETILMKIVRGSNIEGYAGFKRISKVKDYQIIRPLISLTKEDIIEYNKSHNITYFIDNSNTNTNYTRNRYRKYILPLLKKEDKYVHKKFIKYSETLEEYDNYIKDLVKKNINNIYINNIIYIEELNKLDEFLKKNTLYYIMNNIYLNQSNIITEKHITSILKLINNQKPNITLDLPLNKRLIKEYNIIRIEDKTSKEEDYKIKFENTLTINNFTIIKEKQEESDSNSICRINLNNISPPLYFRNRKEGDYIILKGCNHKKKIKEIFIENKIPITKRNSYPLLVDSSDNIIWIPNIKKSKFCTKKEEKCDIILKCQEREDKYE